VSAPSGRFLGFGVVRCFPVSKRSGCVPLKRILAAGELILAALAFDVLTLSLLADVFCSSLYYFAVM
jgi:hypothetical protein